MIQGNKTLLTTIFFLSFSSGLPFLLILATLSVWLAEVGMSKTVIGLFALTTLPYSFKFIWAPFVDQKEIPILGKMLGQRRSWLLLAQLLLILSLLGLALTDPSRNLLLTAIFALLVGTCSATQDVVVEAYRVEALYGSNNDGLGASASVLGYRLGMLVAGAGALYLAAFLNSWTITYILMALCVSVGIITTLLCNESQKIIGQKSGENKFNKNNFKQQTISLLKKSNLQIIVPFILCFKLADTVLNTMSMPFLIEIGFSKLEIAHVAKTFGITAMIIGGIFAGAFLVKRTLWQLLLICCLMQLCAGMLFVMQALLGRDLPLLLCTMGIENLACGMSQVALIAYLSKLCHLRNTATHYALLSSFASFVRVNFSILGGWLADQMPWHTFYTIVSLSCIPSIVILLLYFKHFVSLSPENDIEVGSYYDNKI